MRLIYRRGREEIAFPIDEGETYVGRKDYCEIHFPDGSLSKRHARLVRKGSELRVYDAGSRNGTRINGERIDEATLHNGDELECGKVMFRVEGIPDASGVEFEVLDESQDQRGSRSSSPGGRRSRSRGSRSRAGGSLLVTAKAVASTDARPSMLDVLPELPPSVEREGADGYEDGPRATLKLVDGGPPKEWELGEETVTLGSKEENAVVLTGDGVSRYHAEIVFEDGVWMVKDLGARNGIFVAGERVDIYELKDGDEIQIGTCRLRFRLVKPDPLAEVKAVLAAVRADPVGAFKSDSRVRIGAVGLVVGVCLFLLLIPGARNVVIAQGTDQGPQDWMVAGTAHMEDGEYLKARTVFMKAKSHVPTSQQKLIDKLQKLASLWVSLDKGPASFRWDKAEKLLKESTRLKNLSKGLQAWRAKQFDFVELNKSAFKIVQEAEKVARQGDDAAARPDVDRAIEFYDQATKRAAEVSRSSLFSPRSDKLVASVRKSAFRMLLRDATRVTRQTPDWSKGLKLLERAADFTDSPSDRAKIRTMADKFDRNGRDEVRYMQGVAIVRNREVERYSTATDLFGAVHPQSRVYPDARAYIEWIEADRAVRAAKGAYDLGQARRAFQLLSDALNHDVLGEDAIDSVKRRHTAWSRVVRAWDRGYEHKGANELKAARKEFEFVLQNEKNPKNSFHARARQEIKSIDDIVRESYARKVERAMGALADEDWGKLHLWAQAVQSDPNNRAADVRRIRVGVAEANKKYRLLKRANRQFMKDNEDEFPKMVTILRVLVAWLPKKHKARRPARKLLEKVAPRIRNWRKRQRGD
jgi:pSer/pThr/pTyr-binding forkhead associated (FHA) protein/tetratricopeptide (TPR) repeat protein